VVVWIVVGAVVVALFVFAVLVYNHLVRLRNEAETGWANIDVQLKRRADLVPNLVEAVKGYAAHERETFQAVTDARTKAMSASGPAQAGAAEGLLSQALGRLFAVAEAYPQLRATENFQQLQAELTNTEDQIAAARRIYNGNVQAYNTKIQVFPNSIIAGMGGFTKRDFFEIEDAGDREPVKVDFSTTTTAAATPAVADPAPAAPADAPPAADTPPAEG